MPRMSNFHRMRKPIRTQKQEDLGELSKPNIITYLPDKDKSALSVNISLDYHRGISRLYPVGTAGRALQNQKITYSDRPIIFVDKTKRTFMVPIKNGYATFGPPMADCARIPDEEIHGLRGQRAESVETIVCNSTVGNENNRDENEKTLQTTSENLSSWNIGSCLSHGDESGTKNPAVIADDNHNANEEMKSDDDDFDYDIIQINADGSVEDLFAGI